MVKKMNKVLIYLAVATSITLNTAYAVQKKSAIEIGYIRQELQQIIDVNLKYQEIFHDLISEQMLKKQMPDATIVLCSDSRVDTNTINDMPAGQLFMIRNIGNQVETAIGSVEYGVNNLHTPMLLIVGHSGCGAVKAAMSDYSGESPNLKNELGTLHVDPKATLNQNIVNNVNNQIRLAMSDFADKIENSELVIIGLIYDIHNDFKYGSGKIIVVNINNETNPKELAENQYIKGLKNVTLLQ